MALRRTIALTFIALFGLLPSGLQAESAPDIQIRAQTTEQAELAGWALERFAAAGLRLSDLAIEFPGSNQALCDGAPARAYLDQTPITVRMCWNDPFILLHELAHVWEAQNVIDESRDEFMGMREQVHSWASLDHRWEERGREHAANVIAWGLLEDPYPISRTYPNDPDNMRDAFRLLTGTEPLHDGGPGVQLPDRTYIDGRSNEPLESGR
jgi:hypothetical protein